jgi:hypothetical protein
VVVAVGLLLREALVVRVAAVLERRQTEPLVLKIQAVAAVELIQQSAATAAPAS